MSDGRPVGTTCDLCDRPAYDTGRRDVRDGRTWRVAHCDGCGDDITFWEAPRPRRLDVRTDGPVATVQLRPGREAAELLYRHDGTGAWVCRTVLLATGASDEVVLDVADAERRLAGAVHASQPVVRVGTTLHEGEAGFAPIAERVERSTGRRPVDRLATLHHGRFEVIDHLLLDGDGIGERTLVWGEGALVLDVEITGQRAHWSDLVATGRVLATPWCLDDWLVIGVDRRHHLLLELA